MMQIAQWTNSLGEEMFSQVYATFDYDSFIVVWDWREATRGHGFVVIAVEDATLIVDV